MLLNFRHHIYTTPFLDSFSTKLLKIWWGSKWLPSSSIWSQNITRYDEPWVAMPSPLSRHAPGISISSEILSPRGPSKKRPRPKRGHWDRWDCFFLIGTEITNYTFWGNPLEPSGSVFRERVMKGYVLFLIHIYFVPSCFIANLLSVEKILQFFQDFLHRIEACSFAGIFNPRTRSTTCSGMSPNQTVFKVFFLILFFGFNCELCEFS